jgi:hypothetical protein
MTMLLTCSICVLCTCMERCILCSQLIPAHLLFPPLQKQHEVDAVNAALQKWFKEDLPLYRDLYKVSDLQHDADYRQAYQNAMGLTKGGDKWER